MTKMTSQHWSTAKMIASGVKFEQARLVAFKQNLGLHPSRFIRFADRSDTEDLIVFEVKNSHWEEYMLPEERDRHLEDQPYLLIVSIASDDVPEQMVIPADERMKGVVEAWI